MINILLSTALASALMLGSIAGAAESPECKYNEFSGELWAKFEAHEKQNSRAWVPLRIYLCKNDQGTYVIVAHRAVGLGTLSNPPLKTEGYRDLKTGDAKAVLLISNQEDDREALKALESRDVEVAVVGGTSATQVTVFRKELDRVFSNTLFGGKVKK